MSDFDAAWSSEDLASNLCDRLVATGQLKENPAFIRKDREEKLVELFTSIGLDGARMDTFPDVGPLEALVRNGSGGEIWLDSVLTGLKGMLSEDVRTATPTVGLSKEAQEELQAAKEITQQKKDKGKGRGKPDRGEDCYNCGAYGHLARDCPEPQRPKGKSGGRSAGGDENSSCFNCGRYGHLARDCPEQRRPKGAGKSGGKIGRNDDELCYNCGGYGHLARECPEPRKGKGGGKEEEKCYNCGGYGHLARECPEEPRKGKGKGGGRSGIDEECYNCGRAGHIAKDCPEPRKPKGGGKR